MIHVLRLWQELRLALMLLTRLPAGRFQGEAPPLPTARWAFALVGLPVGAIAWAGYASASACGASAQISALIAVCLMVLATGGLHHDGLADFADGIWGGHDRKRRLEIMRDSRIGSYGVLALIFAVAFAVAAMTSLDWTGPRPVTFLAMAVASRFLMHLVLEVLPPARADGLGHMAVGQSKLHLIPGALLCAVFLIPLGLPLVIGYIAMLLIAVILAVIALRTVGGQTGDVLGAVQVASEVTGWMVLAQVL